MSKRVKGWKFGVEPDLFTPVLESKFKNMLESFIESTQNLDVFLERVNAILDEKGVFGNVRIIYRSFAEELFKAYKQFSKLALHHKVSAITSKYVRYGCDPDLLLAIGGLLGDEVLNAVKEGISVGGVKIITKTITKTVTVTPPPPQVTYWSNLNAISITMPTPTEVLLSTPIALPTTAPTTPEISFTLDLTDFPAISGNYYDYDNVLYFIVAGQNTAKKGGNVYFDIYVNGVSVLSGSYYVDKGYYYTLNFWIFGVKALDTIELYAYADITGVEILYYAYQVQPSRLLITSDAKIKKITYNTVDNFPTLTLGVPEVLGVIYGGLYAYPNDIRLFDVNSGITIYVAPSTTYGIFLSILFSSSWQRLESMFLEIV